MAPDEQMMLEATPSYAEAMNEEAHAKREREARTPPRSHKRMSREEALAYSVAEAHAVSAQMFDAYDIECRGKLSVDLVRQLDVRTRRECSRKAQTDGSDRGSFRIAVDGGGYGLLPNARDGAAGEVGACDDREARRR